MQRPPVTRITGDARDPSRPALSGSLAARQATGAVASRRRVRPAARQAAAACQFGQSSKFTGSTSIASILHPLSSQDDDR
jgi:hypothetical protein